MSLSRIVENDLQCVVMRFQKYLGVDMNHARTDTVHQHTSTIVRTCSYAGTCHVAVLFYGLGKREESRANKTRSPSYSPNPPGGEETGTRGKQVTNPAAPGLQPQRRPSPPQQHTHLRPRPRAPRGGPRPLPVAPRARPLPANPGAAGSEQERGSPR